jgi:CRISPR/Cas system-associated protein Cas10 (large subunit of type III CRISPR-Cas system)
LCGQLKEVTDLHKVTRVNLAIGDQPTLLLWVNENLKDFYGSAKANSNIWSKQLATLRGNMIKILESDEIAGNFFIILNITFSGKTHHSCFFFFKAYTEGIIRRDKEDKVKETVEEKPIVTGNNEPPLILGSGK